VLLNGGAYVGFVRNDGAFVIHNVPAGSYVLDVAMNDFTFQPVRVDVSAKDKGKARASSLFKKDRLPYPLVMRPTPTEYFQKRVPYDWLGMLKNPMVLMMGVPLILMFMMPKLDPKEMEAVQKDMGDGFLGKMMKATQQRR